MENNDRGILYISKVVGKRPCIRFDDLTESLHGHICLDYKDNLKLWCNADETEPNILLNGKEVNGNIFITGSFKDSKLTGINKDNTKDIIVDLITKDISIDSDDTYKPSDLFIEFNNALYLEPNKFSFIEESEVTYCTNKQEFIESSDKLVDDNIKKVISLVFKNDNKDVDTIFEEITGFIPGIDSNWYIIADMIKMYEDMKNKY